MSAHKFSCKSIEVVVVCRKCKTNIRLFHSVVNTMSRITRIRKLKIPLYRQMRWGWSVVSRHEISIVESEELSSKVSRWTNYLRQERKAAQALYWRGNVYLDITGTGRVIRHIIQFARRHWYDIGQKDFRCRQSPWPIVHSLQIVGWDDKGYAKIKTNTCANKIKRTDN